MSIQRLCVCERALRVCVCVVRAWNVSSTPPSSSDEDHDDDDGDDELILSVAISLPKHKGLNRHSPERCLDSGAPTRQRTTFGLDRVIDIVLDWCHLLSS